MHLWHLIYWKTKVIQNFCTAKEKNNYKFREYIIRTNNIIYKTFLARLSSLYWWCNSCNDAYRSICQFLIQTCWGLPIDCGPFLVYRMTSLLICWKKFIVHFHCSFLKLFCWKHFFKCFKYSTSLFILNDHRFNAELYVWYLRAKSYDSRWLTRWWRIREDIHLLHSHVILFSNYKVWNVSYSLVIINTKRHMGYTLNRP